MDFQQIFVDGVSEVSFGQGAVRIDFYTLSHDKRDAEGNPARILVQRLVMTPQGFADSLGPLQATAEKLVQVGILSRREATAEPAPPVSSNFG